jgi:hypothetical protein
MIARADSGSPPLRNPHDPRRLTLPDVGDRQNLPGRVYSLTRFNNLLYAGTSTGLYVQNPTASTPGEAFIRLPGFSHPKDLTPAADVLHVGSDIWGLLDDENNLRVLTTAQVLALHQPSWDSRLMLAATLDGVLWAELTPGGWEFRGRIQDLPKETFSLTEDNEGWVWVGLGSGRVGRLRRNAGQWTTQEFDTASGVPGAWTNVVFAGGRLIVAAHECCAWDASQGRFVPAPDLVYSLPAGRNQGFEHLLAFPDGSRYTARESGDGRTFRAPSDEVVAQASRIFNAANLRASTLWIDDDGTGWIGSGYGLVRVENLYAPSTHVGASPRVSRVINLGNPEAIHFDQTDGVVLPWDDRSVRFEVALPDFVAPHTTEYRVFLEGFDRDWPEWSRNAFREYTNLPWGEYTLRVAARSLGTETEASEALAVTVERPFFATWKAYSFYALLAGACISLLLRWRVGQLRRHNRALQALERTAELERQSRQVAQELRTAGCVAVGRGPGHRGPRRSRCQGTLPGQHVARDPHPDERRHRHVLIAGRLEPDRRATGLREDDPPLWRIAADGDQRHPGLLQGGVRTPRAGEHPLRSFAGRGGRARPAGSAGAPQAAGTGRAH